MTTPSSANDQIRALIVDDEADIRRLTVKAIERSGFDCHAVAGIKEALSALQETAYNFCITDMRLPDGDGLSLIRHVNQHYPDMPIAMITAYGNLEVGVDALKSGAFDVLAKPLELSSLRNLAEAAKKLLKKRSPLPTYCHSLLFGDSAIMETFRATLYRLARTQAPVNITAPEGCDRRGIARALHYLSTRASQPFISVNCASLHNQENYDSEGAVLFGDVLPNDSSISSEQGIFQIANKGSVFLENIDQLSEFGQMRLIELLEERQLRNLQDGTLQDIDVRFMSHIDPTNTTFRADLLYRLQVINLVVPPLNERPEDIIPLAKMLIRELATDWDMPEPSLSAAAAEQLRSHTFTMDIAELQHIVQGACALTESTLIAPEHLQLKIVENKHSTIMMHDIPSNLEGYLEGIERQAIEAALAATEGNKTAAAAKLGVSFRTMRYRCKKLNIQ